MVDRRAWPVPRRRQTRLGQIAHVEHADPQVDPDHHLHQWDDDDQARSLHPPEPAEHEDHPALVFAQDAERIEQNHDWDENDEDPRLLEYPGHDWPNLSSRPTPRPESGFRS